MFGNIRLAGTGEVLSIGSVVDFTKVRIVLLRTNGDTAVDRVINFPADSTSIRLSISVTLSEAATSEGETFAATIKYINAAGDTVFSGGPVAVVARAPAGGSTQPPEIPVKYSGCGANAAAIAIKRAASPASSTSRSPSPRPSATRPTRLRPGARRTVG